MMEMIRRWASNPANPKNVQIPLTLFLALEGFLGKIDPSTLTFDEVAAYELAHRGVKEKKDSIRNRQAYSAVIHAGKNEDDRKTALNNYLNTKQLGKLGV